MTHPTSARTGARVLVDQLKIHGVDHVFCVPGESYLRVLDALYDEREQIRLTVNRHESGASFMADAYGKLTGRPGVCFVTRGPGATNASIGVHTAYQDSTPMILFIGQVGTDFMDREAFQEIDYRRMFGPMAKWVAQIDRADRVPEYIARAFSVATSGRMGPVVLALPEDMLVQTTDVGDASAYQSTSASPSQDQMHALADALRDAARPIVLLGGSGWDSSACAAIEQFAADHALPVACVFRRQDLFDNDHPHYVGDVGIGINPALAQRIKESDLVLCFGARLGEMTTSGYTLFDAPVPTQRLIHVHSSAEELGSVFQPALAIQSGMVQLARALAQLPKAPENTRLTHVRAMRAAYDAWQTEPAIFRERPQAINLWNMVQSVFARWPNALLANGAGNFATWGHRFHRYPGLSTARSQLAPTSGAMGYGVPAGIAAALIQQARPVVVFCGDGDFLMTGQELASAVLANARLLIILFNNAMYGTIRMHQEREFPARVHGTLLSSPDYAALARAYGAIGLKVEREDQLGAALDEAMAAFEQGVERPVLIEILTDPDIISPSATVQSLRSASAR